ncbi:hypothetical protein PF003_g18619 [Phytophthora fragariae]|nr:hypothetical protein PF003_g18619 [Phytophthora fragariae]
MQLTRKTHAESRSLQPPYTLDDLGLEERLLSQSRDPVYAGVGAYRDLLRDLQVTVGTRPNLKVHLRELHAGHCQRCSGGGSPIGVLVSGPESLKAAT